MKTYVALQEHSGQAEHTSTNNWRRSPDGKSARCRGRLRVLVAAASSTSGLLTGHSAAAAAAASGFGDVILHVGRIDKVGAGDGG